MVENTISKVKIQDIEYDLKVEVDWAETDETSAGYIKNKPAIKAGAGTNSILVGEISTNTAAGDYAYAGGRESVASGANAHAEGYKANASGSFAYAQGRMTKASGYASHAEGTEAVAKGYASHAEGMGTIAGSSYQHVQGLYNIEDTTATYLHIVGNGGGSSLRSNAHTLDKDGNAWFAGDVYVGGTSQDNAKKLAAYGTAVITLSKSLWVDNEQSVSCSIVTSDNLAIITPAPESHITYSAYGVRAMAQAEGSLTFTCEDIPTEDLNVNVLIFG